MIPILDVQDVSKNYSSHPALCRVSIEIPEQSVYGILGPNGAGKTSLIRIINQITGPDEGQVFFRGEKIGPKHISKIGYLPEERGLYRKMKVGEQAIYLARLKGLSKSDAKNKISYWFEKFEITGWWDKKVEELSKGMQQKIQFIVTVLHEPDLLILDEPFSGFDPINANLIKNEILELKKKGATIIFSTHNMGSVEEMCDHIALINKSEVVLKGSINEIRQHHRANLFKVGYRGTPMAFAHALWTGAEIVEEKHQSNFISATIKLLGNITTNNLLSALLPVVEIVEFQELLPSINDIFIRTVSVGNSEIKNNYQTE
ncbi:MAG: ABC transporter ATP-binding protein [Bacteroidota bacterium]|jgi:ABC-2 type transport system ATP-binding protein